MSAFRGYVASRPIRGEFTPQHVQNLVIRDYTQRHGLEYRLSATEYSMPGCTMMLEGALAELEADDSDIVGLVLFSLFMLPSEPAQRHAIYQRVLARGASLCFALEDLRFGHARDIDRLEDLFFAEAAARAEIEPTSLSIEHRCPLCGGGPKQVTALECRGVTSDNKPWPRVSPLCSCSRCGLVFNQPTDQWHADCASIYADYNAYPVADGDETKIPDSQSLAPRSKLLAEFVIESRDVPERGRLLDVGCGNGAFLRAFAAVRPDWELVGVDRSDSGADAVRAIGAEFIHGDLPTEELPDFDLISLVHVLEHVARPIDWLSGLRLHLADGGAILVDVPDYTRNPFDLAVVDHALHFDDYTLHLVAARAGLRIDTHDTTLIGKEHVALLSPGEGALPDRPKRAIVLTDLDTLSRRLFDSTVDESRPIGVLGTSIAATWTADVLGDSIDFFVDEDPARQGRRHLGRPIVSAADAPSSTLVIVAQPAVLAQRIANRLETVRPDIEWRPLPAHRE